MPYREVDIFDRNLPGIRQIIAGEAKNNRPKRVWKRAMGKDEFAVLFRHGRSIRRFMMPDGKLPKHPLSASCLIFDNLEEARTYSRELLKRSKQVVCSIYSESDVIERIQNRKSPITMWINRLLGVLLGLLIYGAFFCCLELAAYELFQWLLGHPLPAIGSYGVKGWVLFWASGWVWAVVVYRALGARQKPSRRQQRIRQAPTAAT